MGGFLRRLTPGPRTTPVRGWGPPAFGARSSAKRPRLPGSGPQPDKPPGWAARVDEGEAITPAPRAARTPAARARTPPPRDVVDAAARFAPSRSAPWRSASSRAPGGGLPPVSDRAEWRGSLWRASRSHPLSRRPIRAHALRVPTALKAHRHGEPSWPVPHPGGWPRRGSGGSRSRRAAGRRALEVQRECDPRRSEQPGGEPPRPGRSVRAALLGHHLVGRKAHHG